ncbi:MAG: hypothetical protein P1P84_06840 [Deferrisomatales bacterium]|nr:hypothetical protein [Deferrisomatales bacterium]
MNKTRRWRRVPLLVTAGLLCVTSAFAGQWLRTAVDPTCAVIEAAEYDASRKLVRITGRSTETITLRIYDRGTNDTLIVARYPETGRWSIEFDLVGTDTTPGMVVVQGTSGCASFRLITDDTFGQAPQTGEATMVATLGIGLPRQ